MRSTVPHVPLTLTGILRHGARIYGDSRVVTRATGSPMIASFAEVDERVARLAGGLRALGVDPGDRVATFGWNHQAHLEAYLAVPCSGAVLHTLNIRLFPEQLTYIVRHAADRVILVDGSLTSLLADVIDELDAVERFVVLGEPDAELPRSLGYEELLDLGEPVGQWPDVDEDAAAAMCYTSGTTGDPKGVVYSHRSTVLHTYGICMAASLGVTEHDRVLPVVPMFHANAWGLPYACWFTGADLVLPGEHPSPADVGSLIQEHEVTLAAAVPTVWNDLLQLADVPDLSSLRAILCGGAAVPESLIRTYQDRFGVGIVQGWGMTETGPVAALAHPPRGTSPREAVSWRARTGRILPGVDLRITDDGGDELAWDGEAVGEIEVRGPWVTGSYHGVDASDRFHDGWLRTGDVGAVDEHGFIQISDRSKDVIKSGGEWISSLELENALVAHPDVLEAAVIGVPDERWSERPLACLVLRAGADLSVEDLRSHLSGRVARWWVPERWATIDAIPRTAVGKFDKKVLRRRHADGDLAEWGVSRASASEGAG